MFQALGQLALHGFPIYPDEAMDMIADFEWELAHPEASTFRVDNSVGSIHIFETFFHFATTRLVRSSIWGQTLLSPDYRVFPSENMEIAAAQQSEEARIMLSAVSKLPQRQYDLSCAFWGDAGISERSLARRHCISVYRLRATLVDALGLTSANLAEDQALSEPELSIVRAVWRDGRSSKEASSFLRMPALSIEMVRVKLYRLLLIAFKGTHRMRFVYSPEFGGTGEWGGAIRLLSAAMQPDASTHDLAALADASDEIYRYLTSGDAEQFLEENRDSLRPDVLAAIYRALGADFSSDEAPDGDAAPYVSAIREEERAIYLAFELHLMPALPDWMETPASAEFGSPAMVSADVRDHLLATLPMNGGRVKIREMASYGLTPVKILQATQAVATVARRKCRALGVRRGAEITMQIWIDAGLGHGLDAALTRAEAVREITNTTNLPIATADCVFNWMAQVASFLPQLFEGFLVLQSGPNLVLRRTDESEQNLAVRWERRPNGMADNRSPNL